MEVFGLLRPCAHGAGKYGIDADEWRTHMCGLCLGLRDGHGQLARAATNTDAIVLSMLTEAQLAQPMARTEAGRCALRGMRRATVAAADSPGVLLAATASLLLGAAKIRDHVDDGDTSPLARHPMSRVSTRWAARAQAQADLIGLNVEPLVAAINSQADLERRVELAGLAAQPGRGYSTGADVLNSSLLSGHFYAATGDFGAAEAKSVRSAALAPLSVNLGELISRTRIGSKAAVSADEQQLRADRPGTGGRGLVSLDELTSPTQVCAAELFGHTAILAGRPENLTALRDAGRQFGRIAHLADAIEDFDDDMARGRFNPLAATGTGMPEAYDLLRQSDAQLRKAIAEAGLDRVPVVRWMLLDPLRAVVRRLGRGVGATVHACSAARDGIAPRDTMHDTGTDHRPPVRPGIGEALALTLGVYCTGYACCADHTNPCSGERKDAWIKHVNPCDCCNCGCDDCDCCDCDCCGCDCGC
ncbi:DUF5685 family protein [Nocardia sp. NPDC052566]|uniref:DUF5685 family protein n=1 Tax=Nocardia sp. NPDC052566 TaxID=3364330 RepID=UPI0037C7BBD4